MFFNASTNRGSLAAKGKPKRAVVPPPASDTVAGNACAVCEPCVAEVNSCLCSSVKSALLIASTRSDLAVSVDGGVKVSVTLESAIFSGGGGVVFVMVFAMSDPADPAAAAAVCTAFPPVAIAVPTA